MFSNTQIQQLKTYLLLSLFLVALLHSLSIYKGFDGDLFFWCDWGKMMYSHGLGSVYRTTTDYLPLSHYFLFVYVLFQSSTEGVVAYIEYFKLVPLIVHFIGGYFVVKLIEKDRDEKHPIRKSLFYLLNIPILYNAIIWGQVDIIFTCLAFISSYYALKEKITISLIFLVAAVNYKLQAIVFVPPIALMLFPLMVRDFAPKKLMKWILFPLIFQALILLPYYLDGSIERVWAVVTESFGKYPKISMKAYNIWYLFFPDLKVTDADTTRFAGLPYNTWGLILFFATSFFALFPFLKNIYTYFRSRIYHAVSVDRTLLILGLVPLLFFYFNTQMHERYSHPSIMFILVYGIRTGRPILPFMATWCYFFNLEGALQEFHIDNYGTLIFHPVFISSLWLLVIIGLFLDLYDLGPKFSVKQKHRNAINTWFRNLKSSVQPLINYVNNVKQWKRYLLLSVVVGIILQWLTPALGHNWDTYCWTEWAKSMYTFGLKNIYSTWTEYMPLFQYFLKVYTLFQLSADAAAANIHYLKAESLILHLISGYFVMMLIQKNKIIKNPVTKTLFYLLNFAVLFNSMIWGQVDVILAAFLLMSYYYAVEQKISLSLFFYVAAINFKIHAIVFMPPLGLMLLPLMVRDFTFGRLLKWIFVPLGFQLLILSPFIYTDDLGAVWAVIVDSFGRYKSISLNAFNFWYLVFPDLTMKDQDTEKFLGLMYRNWGMILFFVACCFALFPLFKNLFLSLRQKKFIELPVDKTLLIFALIPFLFFYFNTVMHERYSHPGLIFVIIYGIRQGRLFLPFLASLAYLSNLAAVMGPVHFPSYRPVFFEPVLVSLFWLVSIAGLFFELYDLRHLFIFRKKVNGTVPVTQ